MPTQRIKRFQKHVTITIPTKSQERIQILRTPPGVSLVSHPLSRQNKGYANISLLASDIQVPYPTHIDMDEKIDKVLADLHVVNDNVKGKEEPNIRRMKSSKNKHGPSREYYLDSPELDGENDYLKSRLTDVHSVRLTKEQIRHKNQIFKMMGYNRGLNERQRVFKQGELYSDNAV
jgi:hypothetical protein